MELNMVNVKFIFEKIVAVADAAIAPQKGIRVFLTVI
jgi:hypothetical protein